MVSFLTEAARNETELNKIEDVNTIIAEEIEKICNTASLSEITKTFLLLRRLENAPVDEKEIVKNKLNGIAEKLITRVETKSGPLKLSETCLHLFSEL